ncbi:MAG: hypothetical protein HY909_16000 [Deltaproteobacteria bacterium]|nr:hypothetical protein [Deltaproteobacteria bacterium]
MDKKDSRRSLDESVGAPTHQAETSIAAATERFRDALGELLSLAPGERGGLAIREGEISILRNILDITERHPALFSSLADRDHGKDPNVFEVDLLRRRLDRYEHLGAVKAALTTLLQQVGDTMTQVLRESRPVIMEAYHLASAMAKTRPETAAHLRRAREFYGRSARAGARTRAKNRGLESRGPTDKNTPEVKVSIEARGTPTRDPA